MVALTAELFSPEIFQVLRPIEVVKIVPLPHGGAGREKVLELFQLVLGHGVEGDGHAPAAAVVGDLLKVLPPSAPQGQGKGGAQTGVLHLEIQGAAVHGPLGFIDIPPDKHGAGGGVADAAAAVAEKLAQAWQVLQPEGVEIQHKFTQILLLI